MSYNTRVEGELTVSPPLTWNEMKGSVFLPDQMLSMDPFRPGGRNRIRELDIVLVIDQEEVETDEGTLTRKTARRVTGRWNDTASYGYLRDDVQRLLNFFPEHTIQGYFECNGEGPGDLWRVVIHKGKAVQIEPTITWELPV